MNKIKKKIEKNLKKNFNINNIKNEDKKKLKKKINSYEKMTKKQYNQLPLIILTRGYLIYIFSLFLSTVLGFGILVLTISIMKVIFDYYQIYVKKTGFINKKYKRRNQFYKIQYPVHIFIGLFGLNYIMLIIEVMLSLVIIIFKEKIDSIWQKYDNKMFKEIKEESIFQRKTRMETKIENEYYYEVKKYLKETE